MSIADKLDAAKMPRETAAVTLDPAAMQVTSEAMASPPSAEFYSDVLTFLLNGEPVTLVDPDPTVLLVDFLRRPEIGLTGTKLVCGEGGCGACTVTVSRYDPVTKATSSRPVNACLNPLCALDGSPLHAGDRPAARGDGVPRGRKPHPRARDRDAGAADVPGRGIVPRAAASLEAAARVLASGGRFALAAQLAGAADQSCRDLDVVASPLRLRLRAGFDPAREALGEEDYARELEAGRKLTITDALERALAEVEALEPAKSVPAGEPRLGGG